MPPRIGLRPYPDARHVVEYLADYEERYELPVERPVRVLGVHRDGERLRVETDSGTWRARAVISATGTWWRPFLPAVPGRGGIGVPGRGDFGVPAEGISVADSCTLSSTGALGASRAAG